MSTIIGEVDSDITKVADKIIDFMDIIGKAEDCFDMAGKTLEQLCKTHPHNMAVYIRKLQEAKAIEDFLRMRLDALNGKYWKKYTEGYSMKLTQKDIQHYVNNEPEYISMKTLMLEVSYVKSQLQAIVDTFSSMGYSHNNITKIRVAELEHAIL